MISKYLPILSDLYKGILNREDHVLTLTMLGIGAIMVFGAFALPTQAKAVIVAWTILP